MQVAHIPENYKSLVNTTILFSPPQKILNIPWKFADRFEGAESLEVIRKKNNETVGRLAYIHNNAAYFVDFKEESGRDFKSFTLKYCEEQFWLRLTWKEKNKVSTDRSLTAYDFANKLEKMDSILREFVDPRNTGKKHCGFISIPIQFSDLKGPVQRPVYWFYDRDYKDLVLPLIKQRFQAEGFPVVVK